LCKGRCGRAGVAWLRPLPQHEPLYLAAGGLWQLRKKFDLARVRVSVAAPSASSGCHGTPILRTSTISSGALSAWAISNPTATPPRGNAKTTGCRSLRCASLPARRRPASARSENFIFRSPRNSGARRVIIALRRISTSVVKLLTRTGLDWTHKYPLIAAAVAALGARQASLDGELCGVFPDGITSSA
jgi:hypothetical protein